MEEVSNSGSRGEVRVGTTKVAEITEWSLKMEADILDTASFGNQSRTYTKGLKEWYGSFSARWNMENSIARKAFQEVCLGGITVTLKLYIDDTHYYSGDALIEPIEAISPDGSGEMTFHFQGSGPLSHE